MEQKNTSNKSDVQKTGQMQPEIPAQQPKKQTEQPSGQKTLSNQGEFKKQDEPVALNSDQDEDDSNEDEGTTEHKKAV